MDSRVQQCQIFCHADFYLSWLKHSESYRNLEFGTTLTLYPQSLEIASVMIILEKKTIIVAMKLSDIQEKRGWSLNMITCL